MPTAVFPFPGTQISAVPSIMLSKTETWLLGLNPSEQVTYAWLFHPTGFRSMTITTGNNSPLLASEFEYETDEQSVFDSMVYLALTDETRKVEEPSYINFELTVTYSSDYPQTEEEPTIMSFDFLNETVNVDDIDDSQLEMLNDMITGTGLELEGGEIDKDTSLDSAENTVLTMMATTFGAKIRRIKYSIQVPRYVEIMNQGWFVKHSICNGIIYDWIKKGFIQNLTSTKPEPMIYSIFAKARREEYGQVITHNGIKTPACLAATFNITEELERAYKTFTAHERFVSDYDKIKSILAFADYPQDSDITILSGLPGGFSFSREPDGKVIWPSEADMMFDITRHKKHEPKELEAEPEEEIIYDRWADTED